MMEIIHNRDISVMHHATDGFTLAYLTDEGDYYHKQYTGYALRDAMRLFKAHCLLEDGKTFRCMPTGEEHGRDAARTAG
jgi:hypothetical protein